MIKWDANKLIKYRIFVIFFVFYFEPIKLNNTNIIINKYKYFIILHY